MINFNNFDGENITVKDGMVKELTVDLIAIGKEIYDMLDGSSLIERDAFLCFLEAQKEKTVAIFKDVLQNARKREDIIIAALLAKDITESIDLIKAGGCELAAASFADATEFVKS